MAASKYSLAQQLRNEMEIADGPLGDIFSEEPPTLDVFIRDKKYLNNPALSETQYEAVRHIEQIYMRETYPLMVENFGEYWEPRRFVNFVYLQWGKGSGKDHVCRIATARIANLLLCLKSPQEYFNFAPQDELHILNIAMNAAQAHRAFFKPLGTLLKNSNWFKDKVASEITDQARSIRLDKQIELISGHSEVGGYEGLNLVAGFADEISGFQSSEEKAIKGIRESDKSAEAVLSILHTSASTRFPETYKLVAISYPRYKNDPIQNLCAIGRKDQEEVGEENSRYYVDGPKATWDVNPRIKGKEAFAEDYKLDPLMARSKYECDPQRTANRFFRNDSALSSSLVRHDEGWIEPLTIEYYWGVDTAGAKAEGSYELATVPGWQALHILSPDLVPMEGAIYTLHADLGITSDRAGIAMCHVKNWERREFKRGEKTPIESDYQNDDRPVIKVDFVAAYEADLEAKIDDGELQAREIQIRWFRNLIRELKRKGFVIGMVTFDNFQSTDSIQILESWGIPSDLQSIDRNAIPYTTLRDVMYDGRLEGYHVELLRDELEGVSKLPNGKIDHPPGGSKDMADALCGAVCNSIIAGGDEGEEPEAVDIYLGHGYEVANMMGNMDSFWGDASKAVSAEDLRLSFS